MTTRRPILASTLLSGSLLLTGCETNILGTSRDRKEFVESMQDLGDQTLEVLAGVILIGGFIFFIVCGGGSFGYSGPDSGYARRF